MSLLASRYLGLKLAHPIIASASPLTATFDGMRRLEDAGAAAVVMISLREEEVRVEDAAYATLTEITAGSHPEAATYFPVLPDYRFGLSGHLETLRRAAEALHIPVIASLKGVSDDGWLDFALQLQQAGAAALELDFCFLSTDFAVTGRDIESRYLDVLRRVKNKLKIPISLKLPPLFTAFGNFVKQLEAAGADGVTLFNLFQPDMDVEKLSITGEPELSSRPDIQLPLTWIALLSRQVNLSLAAGGGIDSDVEVVKFLLAGADAVATTLSSLRDGPDWMTTLVVGLERWLERNSFASVGEVRGRLDAAHFSWPTCLLRERERTST